MRNGDDLRAPIFIIAPMGRSGTNYLAAMLATHPDIYLTNVKEDYLTAVSGSLEDYVQAVFRSWERIDGTNLRGPIGGGPDDMLAAIGGTLLDFIGATKVPQRRPLMKTPSTKGLDVGLRLFPNAHYLLLIRDPRSVTESFLKAKDAWKMELTLELCATRWAESMRAVTQTLSENQDAVREGRIVTIRYESLVADPASVLARVFERVGMPGFPEGEEPDKDFPVIGSSFMPLTETGRIDFTPKAKPKDFDPTTRWSDWPLSHHQRFNRICGTLMKRWGYEPVG